MELIITTIPVSTSDFSDLIAASSQSFYEGMKGITTLIFISQTTQLETNLRIFSPKFINGSLRSWLGMDNAIGGTICMASKEQPLYNPGKKERLIERRLRFDSRK